MNLYKINNDMFEMYILAETQTEAVEYYKEWHFGMEIESFSLLTDVVYSRKSGGDAIEKDNIIRTAPKTFMSAMEKEDE